MSNKLPGIVLLVIAASILVVLASFLPSTLEDLVAFVSSLHRDYEPGTSNGWKIVGTAMAYLVFVGIAGLQVYHGIRWIRGTTPTEHPNVLDKPDQKTDD